MAISGGDGSIILTTQVDQTGLKRGMASMKSGVSALSKSFTKIGAAIGVAFGVGALVQFGKQAVQLASDLQEVQNVVDVAFGDMAYKIESFSKTAIENFGISELTAKRTASTYMAMAKGMGIVDDVASDMAITMTGLTADIASFYNMSQERADVILKSVYTGETETLKQLGIVMTEVNLENFAMSQGITKSLSAMTQQEKTMLRYQFVLEQTRLASGDFVRTQDSWANQTRILAERWKEMQTVFGEAFMTIGVLVLPVINNIIVGLTKVAQVAQVVAQWIYKAFTGKELKTTQSQGTALSGVGAGATEAADGMEALGEATGKANKEAKKALAGFDDLQILTSNIADNAGSASSALGGIGGVGAVGGDVTYSESTAEPFDTTAFEAAMQKIGDSIKSAWDSTPVQNFVKSAKTVLEKFKLFSMTMWGDVKSNALTTWGNIQEDLGVSTQNLVKLWNQFWKDFNQSTDTWSQPIIDSVSKLFNSIWSGTIDPFVRLVSRVWADFTGILVGLWNEHGARLLDNIGKFVYKTIGLFQSIYDYVIEPIITPLLENLSWLWEKHLSKMVKRLGDFIGSLINGALEIYNEFIAPLISYLLEKLAPVWSFISELVVGVAGTIVGTLSDIISGILKTLTGIIDFITGVFTGNWKKAWEGIVSIFKGIWEGLSGVAKGVVNYIIDALNAFVAGINKIKFDVPDWVPGIGGKEWGLNIPKIPKLAQGAVIPPNREFLAVLGDQKRGTNIEAPLDTIVEAMNIALQNNGGGQTTKEEHYYLNDTELMSVIYRLVKGGERLNGNSLVSGGAY